jgi:hypothetical protein
MILVLQGSVCTNHMWCRLLRLLVLQLLLLQDIYTNWMFHRELPRLDTLGQEYRMVSWRLDSDPKQSLQLLLARHLRLLCLRLLRRPFRLLQHRPRLVWPPWLLRGV